MVYCHAEQKHGPLHLLQAPDAIPRPPRPTETEEYEADIPAGSRKLAVIGLDERETTQSPSTTQYAARAEQHPRPPTTQGSNSLIDPDLGATKAPLKNSDLQPYTESPTQGNPEPSHKRKREPTTNQAVVPSELHTRKKRSSGKDTKRKFNWQMGNEFIGFVFHVDGRQAWDIANNILKLPVPQNVRTRFIYFRDGSMRSVRGGSVRGAAGIVWPESFTSSKWRGKGVRYPMRVDNTATLELFAIASTLETAIGDIDKDRGSVDQSLPADTAFFQQNMSHTGSHRHNMGTEVFIFTDDCNALRRIDGDLAYPPDGDMAPQLEAISRHSKTLHGLGVHVELHLSPGHCKLPGNVAVDRMAKWTRMSSSV